MREKRILVVDDSKFDRTLLIKSLQKRFAFTPLEADSGERCLEIVAREDLDLILMDIMMPGTYGSEVLMKIRKKHNAIDLPVIMITSRSDTADVVGCLKNGANDYITKPVNFDTAESRIQTHLKLSELSHGMVKARKTEALNAMIVTFNHEINNPLSIALSSLETANWKSQDEEKRCKEALWRIADIVKKVDAVVQDGDVDYEEYSSSTRMIRLKK